MGFSNLEECGVKDGYFLSMKRESPKSIAEVHVFVFDNASGSKEFFNFMKNDDYASITSIGDEAAFYSSGTSTQAWIVRTSNAFIKVITWDGQNTGRIIAEKNCGESEKLITISGYKNELSMCPE